MESLSHVQTSFPLKSTNPTFLTLNTFSTTNLGYPCMQFHRRFDLRSKNRFFPLQRHKPIPTGSLNATTEFKAGSIKNQIRYICRSSIRSQITRNGCTNASSSFSEFSLGVKVGLFSTNFMQKGQCSDCRNVVARSELVGTGSSDANHLLTEYQLGSKLRGLCFYTVTAVSAIFLFVGMLVVHPFVLLFDRYRRKAHHFVAKIWSGLTMYPFIKVEFEGLENLPPADTPAVYVSNHQSFLDIYTLLTLGRCFKFISKTDIFVIPIIGWAMFLMGVIPLRRMDARSQLECLRQCMELVGKGASVFFFPEGTRSKDGKLGAFKKGAFSVAAKTGAPVVPITLMGTGKLMPPGREGILNKGSIKVVVHKPIEGGSPDLLCDEARNIMADVLARHGYGVHHLK